MQGTQLPAHLKVQLQVQNLALSFSGYEGLPASVLCLKTGKGLVLTQGCCVDSVGALMGTLCQRQREPIFYR